MLAYQIFFKVLKILKNKKNKIKNIEISLIAVLLAK